jgi:hypothetical protein
MLEIVQAGLDFTDSPLTPRGAPEKRKGVEARQQFQHFDMRAPRRLPLVIVLELNACDSALTYVFQRFTDHIHLAPFYVDLQQRNPINASHYE